METETTSVTIDVYSLVTNKIIDLLETGTIPWQKPWTEAGLPQNLISKRPYRGINLMLLNAMGFSKNLFLTWKQIKTIGASVKKGEKGTFVVFQKMIEEKKDLADGQTGKRKFFLRYYKVFNVAQCIDIPTAFLPVVSTNDNQPLLTCELIVENMPNCPRIEHNTQEAYYVPSLDYINMPKITSFITSEAYYGTLFHELVHSTGHAERLNRKEVCENADFGTEPYSLEELVAEMGACYLKSHAGIINADLSNNAAYIKGWLDVFKGDKRFVIKAAGRAQRGVEYILQKESKTIQDTNDEFEVEQPE
ncbi:ArdC family protein [Limnovirga soli]|uniref:DUF1738 domain-containing protein n=1 Tax=Limnovirga soli TaxID=2656915 RepID=A0A8J8FCK3_9BACT|nr:zincin-like metallopeptidase domain-containing protein [Limnovirga soli]NNV53879.1 DUF1738 domain-containing protein [Limnovirga soli]